MDKKEFEVLEIIRCRDCGVETSIISIDGDIITYKGVEHNIKCSSYGVMWIDK